MNTNSISVGAAFSTGWNAFKSQLVPLTLMALVMMVILIVANRIPLLGMLLGPAVMGFLILGMWTGAFAALDSKEVKLEMLFSKTDRWLFAALASLLVSVISMVPMLVAGGVIAFLVGGAIMAGSIKSLGVVAMVMAGGVGLVGVIATMVTTLLLSFWPGIALDSPGDEIEAVGKSFHLNKSQILQLILLSLGLMIVGIIGFCLLFVGLIPAFAFGICVVAAAYRQLVPAGSLGMATPPAIPTGVEDSEISPAIDSTASVKKSGGNGLILGVVAVILVLVLGVGAAGWYAWTKLKGVTNNMVAAQEKEGAVTGVQAVDQIMMAAINQTVSELSPDLEVVKINPKTGKLELRYKPTGEKILIDPEKLPEEGAAFLEKVAKVGAMVSEAAPVTEPAPAALTTETAMAAPEMAELKSAPAWVPAYPGWTIKEQNHQSVSGVVMGNITFSCADKIEKVAAFFEEKIKAAGLTAEVQKDEDSGVVNSVTISGMTGDSKKTVNVTLTVVESGLEGNLGYAHVP